MSIGGHGHRRRGGIFPKIREKIFFGQLLGKIRAFFGQKSCKIRKFCKFFEQISQKFGYFDSFSGKNHVKFGHFADFNTYFSGKNFVPPPLKLTELLRLWPHTTAILDVLNCRYAISDWRNGSSRRQRRQPPKSDVEQLRTWDRKCSGTPACPAQSNTTSTLSAFFCGNFSPERNRLQMVHG